MTLTIEEFGYPQLFARDGVNEQSFKFKTSLFKSAWIHLTVVLDQAKKEVRCYIDGSLVGTQASNVDFSKLDLMDYVVGGDMTRMNRNGYTGKIKSLAVYSDVRTESEIKSDMTKVGTSDLLVHYDFSKITERAPKVLTDLSKNKNNAEYSRFFFEEKEPVTDYAFSFAVVGDTQRMAINYPDHFNDIYNYIYDNIDAKNIEMVIGMGDITDSFDKGDQTTKEWAVAEEAFKIIDDYVPHIPIRGNHDQRFGYNKLMSQINYADIITGRYSEYDYLNTYVDMEIGGVPFLFLNLDFALTQKELQWANEVCAKYPNHNIIVSRHAHMSYDYTALGENDPLSPSYDFASSGYLSGDAVWDGLIRKYENIVLVLSGHVGSDLAFATQRKGDKGNIVTEMLIDFQDQDDEAKLLGISDKGLGIVNMLYFSEDLKTLTVETYSTTTGQYFHDKNQYTVTLDMYTNKKYVKPEKDPTPPRNEAKPVEIKMTINSKTAYVNGEAKTLDAAPVIKNSRTLLPVRFLAENLGAEVAWNDATKTATLKTSTTTIEVTINANVMKVNGTGVALDSPAIIENSRTYLPLRAIANALGVSNDNITWDDSTKTATFVK